MNVATHCKFLCGIVMIGFLFSGCAVLESLTSTFSGCNGKTLPKDITTRFESYKEEAKEDSLYSELVSLESDWKTTFYGMVFLDDDYKKKHCFIATQAYKEILKENPNILKVNGISNKIKAEKEFRNKVDLRVIRLKDKNKI